MINDIVISSNLQELIPLTETECKELESCERLIETGIKVWYQVGEALLHIRDKKLYRTSHKTFEEYCRERWDMGRGKANYLIRGTEIYQDLVTIVTKDEPLPTNESQARELAAVPAPLRPVVWRIAVKTAPNGKPTASHIKSTGNVVKIAVHTGAIDDGEGNDIPLDAAMLDHYKVAITEETYERERRQETHIAEKIERKAQEELKITLRDERNVTLDLAAQAAGRVIPSPIQRTYGEGEIVKVGRHTLICGDNRDVADYLKTLQADFVFADPPYNANAAAYDDGSFIWGQDFLIECAPIVAVTPGISSIQTFMKLTAMPYKWSTSCYINNGMTRGALGFGNWIYTALFTTADSLHRNAQDVITISISSTDKDETSDKRQKPPRYLTWLFNLLVPKGGVIIDAFGGSGMSVLVADQLGMTCIAIEKDPNTFAAMVARVEKGVCNEDAV